MVGRQDTQHVVPAHQKFSARFCLPFLTRSRSLFSLSLSSFSRIPSSLLRCLYPSDSPSAPNEARLRRRRRSHQNANPARINMTMAIGTAISHARLLELWCFCGLAVGLVEGDDVLTVVVLVMSDVDNVVVCELVLVEVMLVPVGVGVGVPVWRLLSLVVEVIFVVELLVGNVVVSLAFEVSSAAVWLSFDWVSVEAEVAFTDVGLVADASRLLAAEVIFFVELSPVVAPAVALAVVKFSLAALFFLELVVLCTTAIVFGPDETSNMIYCRPEMRIRLSGCMYHCMGVLVFGVQIGRRCSHGSFIAV